MAAAPLAKLRMSIFDDPVALHQFIVADNSPVLTVVEIVTDNNGKYILFYMIA
jgi:hypothetical protein